MILHDFCILSVCLSLDVSIFILHHEPKKKQNIIFGNVLLIECDANNKLVLRWYCMTLLCDPDLFVLLLMSSCVIWCLNDTESRLSLLKFIYILSLFQWISAFIWNWLVHQLFPIFMCVCVSQVNRQPCSNNETYQERLERLEGDKESLVLQVSRSSPLDPDSSSRHNRLCSGWESDVTLHSEGKDTLYKLFFCI